MTVIVAACSGLTADRIAAQGVEEVERYTGHPLTEPFLIEGVSLVASKAEGRHQQSDQGEFGVPGVNRTRFAHTYLVQSDLGGDQVLEAAIEMLGARGYELDSTGQRTATLSAQVDGQRFRATLMIALSGADMSQTIRLSSRA